MTKASSHMVHTLVLHMSYPEDKSFVRTSILQGVSLGCIIEKYQETNILENMVFWFPMFLFPDVFFVCKCRGPESPLSSAVESCVGI